MMECNRCGDTHNVLSKCTLERITPPRAVSPSVKGRGREEVLPHHPPPKCPPLPRMPFNRRVGLHLRSKCSLCKIKEGAKIQTEHPRQFRNALINAVGPFSICSDCVIVLAKIFEERC